MEFVLAVPKKLGPWGRDTPPNWDLQLSPIETIKGVIIREGYIVDGIGFIVVDSNGKTTTKYFGGQGGNRHEITLNPDEFITHISGTYGEYNNNGGQNQIASIKIHTTYNTGGYGPYGKEIGVSNIRQFSTTESLAGYVAVGFFGSAYRYLDSIGFYIRKQLNDRVKKHGPWGSQSPQNWELKLGAGETIKGVIIHEGYIVDGIGFIVVDNNGQTTTKYFGGQAGNRHEITLNPDELITHISGTYGEYSHSNGQNVIASIKIHTNSNPGGYGPYGKEIDVSNVRQFSITDPLTSFVAIGFFGSAGTYLNNIGFYTIEDRVRKHGPWGSQSPPNWEVKLSTGETIKGVIIREGYIVDGIGFIIVDNNGKTTTRYFGGQGGNHHEITLNPDELITHISGTYGEYSHSGGQNQIASIKIHTNANPGGYGPYGKEIGVSNVRYFSIIEPTACHVAVGFFGSAGTYLNNIGFYVNESGP